MLITPAAKIFSGSHTKESHARMRNKTDNPPPATTQAPPASPSRHLQPRRFSPPRLGVTLQDEVLQTISLVGGKSDLGLALINRDLRSGLLELVLVARDGTIKKLFSRTDCERRTVHARLTPQKASAWSLTRPGTTSCGTSVPPS